MQDSQYPAVSTQPPAANRRQAFTLTELLIVIAIIAVLAGLIAAAAVNALRKGRETRITLEMQNMSGAIENFKNDYGMYPPNGMTEMAPSANPAAGTSAALVRADFKRAFAKAFPGHNEPPALIDALAGVTPSGANMSGPLENGMRANEALYFWLAGFSSDPKYPISGPGGPSFIRGAGNEVLEDRNKRYEFDLSRLGPRDDNGAFDASKGRFVTYEINMGGGVQQRQINFWQYTPSGSEQPFVYFDVSRHKPGLTQNTASATGGPSKYDLWAADPAKGFPNIYALKQLREGVTGTASNISNVVFVNQGKFQLLHPGLDDDWGSDNFAAAGRQNADNLLLFPTGPFIGPIADTLTNFTDGTLASASEE
jgi:prepilin-type N-terminal cleavage/methylation domain-containing protein